MRRGQDAEGTRVSRRTVTRPRPQLGLSRRHFIDSNSDSNWEPQRIVAAKTRAHGQSRSAIGHESWCLVSAAQVQPPCSGM